MAVDLRILHTADTHIGADLPKRRGGTRPRRGCDFVDSYRHVLARAREFSVDLVIHAGDLFDTPRPGDGVITAAAEPLWDLASAGIPVILVPGNHERSLLPQALLLTHPNIHILREPGTVVLTLRGLRIAVAGFPCIRHDAAQRFPLQLQETRWEQAAADVNILAIHQTFAGARCGPGNFQFRDGEDVVPCEAIPAGFHYVAAGHIHRHQSLPTPAADGCSIVYAGAPDRITFAEIGEPKGCVLMEFADGRVRPRFVEHDVRPMAILPINVTDCTGPALVIRILESVRGPAESTVVLVRLCGQATRGLLAGLRLTHQIRAARPDLLATVSSQAIEWVSARATFRRPSPNERSAFDVLDAPKTPIISTDAGDIGKLPKTCGTYALYDSTGRLLYVGKALNVRARVRTHARGSSSSAYFSQWSGQIARIDVRPAASELEALLVEAELIRRLGPAFNRQMRSWKRYCYLCAGNEPYGQLQIRPEPVRGRLAFGPLRSRARAEAALEALSVYFGLARCPDDTDDHRQRLLPPFSPARLCARYFAGRCTGPCGGRIGETEYAARVRARNAMLAGVDTPDVAALHDELDRLANASNRVAGEMEADRLKVLRAIAALHETAVLLRDAKALLDRPLRLPGCDGGHMVTTITRHGLRLERLDADGVVTPPITDWRSSPRCWHGTDANGALPKPVADCLCTAVLHLRRKPGDYATFSGGPASKVPVGR